MIVVYVRISHLILHICTVYTYVSMYMRIYNSVMVTFYKFRK